MPYPDDFNTERFNATIGSRDDGEDVPQYDCLAICDSCGDFKWTNSYRLCQSCNDDNAFTLAVGKLMREGKTREEAYRMAAQ